MKRRVAKRHGLESKAFRTRKRRKAIAFSLMVVAVPSLFFSAISYLSYLDMFQIRDVKVLGAQTVSADILQNLAEKQLATPAFHFFSRDTIFTYPKESILAEIASSSPRIKNVSVKTKGLRSVSVEIHERVPQAMWCGDTCMFADADGLLFESASTSDLLVFKGYVEDDHIPYMDNALAFARSLENLKLHAVSMSLTPEADATVLLSGSTTLKLSLSDDPENRIEALQTFLLNEPFKTEMANNRLEYIDLRFGDKIYYKEK